MSPTPAGRFLATGPLGKSPSLPSCFSLSLVSDLSVLPSPQPDGAVNVDSDEGEEPSPEALVRYLSMRRHTVGVADPR